MKTALYKVTPSRFALQEFLYLVLTEGKKQLLTGVREVQDRNANRVFTFQFGVSFDFHRCPADPHFTQHNGNLIAQVTAGSRVKHQFPVVWIVAGHNAIVAGKLTYCMQDTGKLLQS